MQIRGGRTAKYAKYAKKNADAKEGKSAANSEPPPNPRLGKAEESGVLFRSHH